MRDGCVSKGAKSPLHELQMCEVAAGGTWSCKVVAQAHADLTGQQAELMLTVLRTTKLNTVAHCCLCVLPVLQMRVPTLPMLLLTCCLKLSTVLTARWCCWHCLELT